jgi:hypothetical protein
VLLNKELQSLHETIISKLATYISYDATPEMFLEKEDVNPLTCSWVNNYQHNSSLAKYSPHITLLTNHTLNHQDIQKSFIVSQIAICQLGNYCTCRKILYTTNINP